MTVERKEIESAVARRAGVESSVEIDGNSLVLTGFARTEAEKQAALDVVEEVVPGMDVIDNIEVDAEVPEHIGDLSLSEMDAAGFPSATPFSSDSETLEPGDFTDQAILTNPAGESGPSGTFGTIDEESSEGEEVYVPPTDPVRDAEGNILNGFQTTAMDDDRPLDQGTIPGPADEALIDAVKLELREDAQTTNLELQVHARNGVVVLRGVVSDIQDVENAEAVAARVDGVREVREHLEIWAG